MAAAAAGWWYFRRVLPQTSGDVPAAVSKPATITRDTEDVPHIEASTIEDALFAQGYVTAQDRLFQMELARRLPAGEVAEIFGAPGVENDVEMRRLRMRRIAEMHARNMPAEDRRWLVHYARGVNHFIATHRGNLPVEFVLLEFDPAPWTVTDCVLVSMQMMRTLSSSWRDEILKSTLLAVGDEAKVRQLFPVRTGLEFQPGSNAWAISGAHTKSGKPLLASDPHLAFSLPGIWYQVHLKAPGLNAAGVSIPGLPAVIIGHNDHIAWGSTNLHFDVQDLYSEPPNALIAREQELVRVRGAKDIAVPVLLTRHGPIVVSENKQFLASRWTVADPGFYQFPMVELNRASSWQEFRNALRRYPGPPQNFIYADQAGNIGYQAAGILPIRDGFDGDVPVEGPSGQLEWKGTIPFDDLPSAWNPQQGWIVSANQNPFPSGYKYPVNGYFAPHYRANQIRDRLVKREKWDAIEMVSVQRDVYSPASNFLSRELTRVGASKGSKNPLLAEANTLLKSWNGQMEAGSPAAAIVTLAFQHLRKAIVERAAPAKGSLYDTSIGTAVVERLLRERPKDWFQDYDDLILRAYVDAVDEGNRMLGRDLSRWRYGKLNEIKLSNPVLGDLRWIGRYATLGPVQLSGSGSTIQQIGKRVGPSMRMVADLSDWDQSTLTTTTGQSGQMFSGNYRDRWKTFLDGGAIPWRFTKATGDQLVLKPN